MLQIYEQDNKFFFHWKENNYASLILSTHYRVSPFLDSGGTKIESKFNCNLRPLFQQLIMEYNGRQEFTNLSRFGDKSSRIYFDTYEEAEKAQPLIEAYLIAGKLRDL